MIQFVFFIDAAWVFALRIKISRWRLFMRHLRVDSIRRLIGEKLKLIINIFNKVQHLLILRFVNWYFRYLLLYEFMIGTETFLVASDLLLIHLQLSESVFYFLVIYRVWILVGMRLQLVLYDWCGYIEVKVVYFCVFVRLLQGLHVVFVLL